MLTPDQRWEKDIPHHWKSLKVRKIIDQIQQIEDYGIKFDGDGDLGEIILYILDEYFENMHGMYHD